jgi:exodeoxyribonuclease VII large subunit
MTPQTPIFLDCPYSEKDEVKKLGAKFDWTAKKWFIPPEIEIAPFAKWLPKTNSDSDSNSHQDSLSLNDLLLNVQKTITKEHNRRYWVRAELVSVSANVHVYMELADHDSDGKELAKVRATLWSHRAANLLERFQEQTGMAFKAGIKALLQVRVAFHTRYGLSLDVLDIDPNFTLGEMEAKLNRIRLRLKNEGIYNQNKTLAYPSEFCKVAVIAPPQAAGLGDFKSQADVLAKFGLCEFHYYTASFQGKNAETEIPAAIELVKQVNQKQGVQGFDALVMIRGGGAKADLFQLNEYEIIKALCTVQLPVIVGIGHERDQTLLDEVANYACHTPSLVISHIASTIIQNARQAKQNWQIIISAVGEILNRARAENKRLNVDIREQSIRYLGAQKQALAFLMHTIENTSKNQLNQASRQIKSLMEQILLGDPKNLLNRGYAIVRNAQNRLITSKTAAEKEKFLKIEFKDGCISIQRQGDKNEF